MNRRHFVKGAAAGALGASLPFAAGALGASLPFDSAGAAPGADTSRRSYLPRRAEVRLGIASYSLRTLDRERAVAAISDLGVEYVSVKSMHLPYDAAPEEIDRGTRAFSDAGIRVVGGGVIYLTEDSDESMRPLFDYAKAAGFPLMVIGPTRESLPRVERFVQEYDIPVAIHNHGPEDEQFPAPSDALAVIGDMDERIGVCVDVGHTARTGKSVVDEIRLSGARLFDIHMKDLKDLSDARSQCVVGQGAMPVAAIFKTLLEMDYPGYVNLEYEIDAQDPVPGMKQSFANMRGVLDGMA